MLTEKQKKEMLFSCVVITRFESDTPIQEVTCARFLSLFLFSNTRSLVVPALPV